MSYGFFFFLSFFLGCNGIVAQLLYSNCQRPRTVQCSGERFSETEKKKMSKGCQ